MNIEKHVEAFQKVVTQHEGVFNILGTQLDPDMIGSAMGMHFLLTKAFERSAKIFYCGRLSHPQNRSIFTKYNLTEIMSPIQNLPPSSNGHGDNIILVDSSKIDDGRIPGDRKISSPIIVIDHHRGSDIEKTDENFIWLDGVGSASTMVVELLEGLKVHFDEGEASVATMLALGIYNDTDGLVKSEKRDRHAYNLISEFADPDDLIKLIRYPYPEDYYSLRQRSLAARKQQQSKLISGLGLIDSENSDYLAMIADDFIRKDGVSTVIVWAIVDDTIRICARTTDLSMQLNGYLKEKFGPASGAKFTPDGRGEGGALIPLGFFKNGRSKEELTRLIGDIIEEQVFSRKE